MRWTAVALTNVVENPPADTREEDAVHFPKRYRFVCETNSIVEERSALMEFGGSWFQQKCRREFKVYWDCPSG
ncbi:hypothetical protein Q3G72_029442 [Acer saccharum]|nr:hypothetical protein Q3G72_029442 [Acer saccharum]